MKTSCSKTNAAASIPVLDPLCRGGILHVPVEKTAPTKGRQDWEMSGGCLMRDLSVCCLFVQNRCRAGTSCRQVHVDHQWIAAARQQHAGVVTCCLTCGDTGSIASVASAVGAFPAAIRALGVEAPVRFTGLAAVNMPHVVLRELAWTCGAASHLNDAVRCGTKSIDLPWSSVCRLHLKDACKYGKDCKNVHVCCKLGARLLATAAVAVNNVVDPAVRQHASSPAPAPRVAPTPVLENGFATRAMATPAAVPVVVEAKQPRAPEPFRATFRLDEGSLLMKDPDLGDLVFNMPTLHSALSTDSRCDIFGLASPAHERSTIFVPSPSFALCSPAAPTATSAPRIRVR